MNGEVGYSIAQKAGGSHVDEEPPLYSLAVVYENESSETILRDVSYSEALNFVHLHAKHQSYSKYRLNGRVCKVA